MSWLCFLSWAYFLLFSSCKPKFTIFFKLFLKKTNHFWTTPSTLFLFPVSLSSCSLRFLVSLNLFVSFFSILELSFFRFRYQTVFFDYLLRFYVYILQISLLWLQEVAYFQRALHLLGPYLWLLVLLLTCKYFHEVSKMISKTSRRSCKFYAVFWSCWLYCTIWLLFPYFHICFQIYPCLRFLSSNECPFPYFPKWSK